MRRDTEGENYGKKEGYPTKDDGEWQLVQRKKQISPRSQGRTDIAGIRTGNVKETISFYFSDFPDSHGAKEMLRAFALYGKAVEVVIPPKKCKWGKRFGLLDSQT